MMNVEVTAEDRPACDRVSTTVPKCHRTQVSCETHEGQSRVQVLIVFLHESSVILLSLLVVFSEEPGPVIFLGEPDLQFPAA